MNRNLKTKEKSAKRLKLPNQPPPQKQQYQEQDCEVNVESEFFLLNDDCICEILNYLTLKDLCSVSQTCERLKWLATERFNARFQLEANIVKGLTNGKMVHFPAVNDFIKCFGSIRNVFLSNRTTVKELKKLQEDRMVDFSIEEIRFDSWKLKLSKAKGIANISEGSKTLFFANMKVIGDFYTCFLQYWPTMERLILWKSLELFCEEDVKQNWLLETYSKLKYFAWHLDKELYVDDDMKLFFKQNKIEQFSLLSTSIDTLSDCVKNGINITELFFKVRSNVEADLVGLKQFFGEDKSKRLHLLFEDSSRADLSKNLKLLKSLSPNIDGLYFDNTVINKALANTISKMIDLKVLQTRASTMVKYLVDLPNLEEYYFSRGVVSGTFDRIQETMMLFATRSVKLKKMFFRNNSRSLNAFQFDVFDEGRKKLPGAEKLSIYVKYMSSCGFADLSSIKLNYDTLKIYTAERGDVKNPLVNEYTYSNASKKRRHR